MKLWHIINEANKKNQEKKNSINRMAFSIEWNHFMESTEILEERNLKLNKKFIFNRTFFFWSAPFQLYAKGYRTFKYWKRYFLNQLVLVIGIVLFVILKTEPYKNNTNNKHFDWSNQAKPIIFLSKLYGNYFISDKMHASKMI